MMDTYINTIQTFTQLLQQQPTLFSPGMGEELNQLVSPLQTTEAISNALVEWLDQYPAVDQALQTLENGSTAEEQKGPGGQVPPPPTPVDKLKEELLILINALRVNSPHTPGNPPKSK